jgi:dTDP-4-dehydrorhamnose reductase
MKKIFIAGGTGMLGTSLVAHLKNTGYEIITQGYKNKADLNVDMTDQEKAVDVLNNLNPDIVINLICLSDVEENEKKQDLAYLLNVKPVENIAHWINVSKPKVKFIQISTDHLYDNEGFNAEDAVVCRNKYASTKYDAEKVALSVGGLILRTNFFGKSQTKDRLSFTDWVDNCISESRFPITLFDDVFFSPLSLDTLSKMIFHTIKNFKSGVYNLGSNDGLSKADFIYSYSDFLNDNRTNTLLISVEDLDFLAARPKGMMMDVTKFERSFDIRLPTLESEIKSYKKGVN